MDTRAALASARESLAQANADVALQEARLAKGRAVMRRYDKMITENNLAGMLFEAFSQAYDRRHRA